MLYLTADEVIEINAREVGPGLLRDRALLESAVGQPQQTFDGVDLYPTIHEKAGALMFSLIQDHPFLDGNKRTGVVSAYVFYGYNGWLLQAPDTDLIHTAVDIAVGHVDVP